MVNKTNPTLKTNKRTGRGNTGTSRYTVTLDKLSGTDTKAEVDVDDLLLMKFTKDILDKAYSQGLFYYGNKATFLAGKVGVV